MPIFDYSCKHCGCEFEAIVLGDCNSVRCPRCGNVTNKKNTVSLFSCISVQLNKRLKMESEEKLKKGHEMLKKEELRKKRIKIL